MKTHKNTTAADEQSSRDKSPILREGQMSILQPELVSFSGQKEEAEIEEREENEGDQLDDQPSLQNLQSRRSCQILRTINSSLLLTCCPSWTVLCLVEIVMDAPMAC